MARLVLCLTCAIAIGGANVGAAHEPQRICIITEQHDWSFRYLAAAFRRDKEINSISMMIDEASVPKLEDRSVLILVNISPQALRAQPDFSERVRDYVASGGGLIIAASDSWRGKDYPLTRLLPVQFVDGKMEADDAPALSLPSITRRGLRSSILRLVDDPMKNQQLWREGLGACFGKPLPVAPLQDATVLAVDPLRRLNGKEIPLIATHKVGDGNVVFLNNCQAWRWRAIPVGNYHGRFWKQLAQFVAKEP